MTFTPAKELEVLRAKTHRFDPMVLGPGDKNPLDSIRAELLELRVEFEPVGASEVAFNIRDVMVIYDPKKQELSVAGHHAPAPLRNGKQRLTVFCDRTGVEVFASGGLCYVPMPFNTNPENRRILFEVRGGAAKVNSLEVYELTSAWKQR
jgi:sucrose-6-phosphate hydrolase SacC (GH32 family)